jgi:hypothetical protein
LPLPGKHPTSNHVADENGKGKLKKDAQMVAFEEELAAVEAGITLVRAQALIMCSLSLRL